MTLALLTLFPDDVDDGTPLPDYRAERNLARSAEYLVAHDISRRGWDCFLAGEGLRYDLIADINGLRRIQVKMCRRPRYWGEHATKMSYTFGNKHNYLEYAKDVDLFAFVAMDQQTILYVLSPIQTQAARFAASTFTPEVADLSWSKVELAWCGA